MRLTQKQLSALIHEEIKKVKGGYKVYPKKPKKGEKRRRALSKKPMSYKKALSQLRAVERSKSLSESDESKKRAQEKLAQMKAAMAAGMTLTQYLAQQEAEREESLDQRFQKTMSGIKDIYDNIESKEDKLERLKRELALRKATRRSIKESIILNEDANENEIKKSISRALQILDIENDEFEKFLLRIARTESGYNPKGLDNITDFKTNPFQIDEIAIKNVKENINLKKWRAFVDEKKSPNPANMLNKIEDQTRDEIIKSNTMSALFAALNILWFLKAWDPEKRKSYTYNTLIGSTVEAQAKLWKNKYNTSSGSGDEEDFIKKNSMNERSEKMKNKLLKRLIIKEMSEVQDSIILNDLVAKIESLFDDYLIELTSYDEAVSHVGELIGYSFELSDLYKALNIMYKDPSLFPDSNLFTRSHFLNLISDAISYYKAGFGSEDDILYE